MVRIVIYYIESIEISRRIFWNLIYLSLKYNLIKRRQSWKIASLVVRFLADTPTKKPMIKDFCMGEKRFPYFTA